MTISASKREALLANMATVYERQAETFDRQRSRALVERGWLDRFLDLTPPDGLVLDMGCGAGQPVAEYLLASGRQVTGIDRSNAMLELAATRFPDARWLQMDMRELALETPFDGVLGWHSFFHLTPDEQRSALPRFVDALRPGGALMLTVGPEAGEVSGTVGGEPVYHASLSPDEYAAVLSDAGAAVVAFQADDPACDCASVLLARRERGLERAS